MDSTPVVYKKRGISPIWTLPVLALAICVWLLYHNYRSAGVDITIYFEDASGIVPGKTQVIAKGIPVGIVKAVQPDLDRHRVRVIAKMDKDVEKYLVKDTSFWVVRPELSAARIYGLETLLSGVYIGIQTGVSAVGTLEFTGLSNPPPVPDEAPGLHLFLRTDALHSLQVGSGIYYRNIRIGSVQTYSLEGDDSILINIYVQPEYAYLVREKSRFANASGITFSGKLLDLKVHVESIASLLMGGVVLETPEPLQNSPPAKNGRIYALYKDIDVARYGLPMTLRLVSGAGITAGVTRVMFRGLDTGFVKTIDLNKDSTLTAHILLDPRAEAILKKGTRFWLTEPQVSLNGIKNLDTLLSGPQITFEPGEGPFRDHFEMLPAPPQQRPLRPGSEYVLTTEAPCSFAAGAPVLYKDVQVGEVIGVEPTPGDIRIRVFIYRPHDHLVNRHSVFWKSGGIKVDAGLFSGVKVETGSLLSVLRGGISFLTPGAKVKKTAMGTEGHAFPLYDSFDDCVHAVPSLRPPGYYFQIRTDNLGPYNVGSPILYKKVAVGEIVGFHFSGRQKDVLMECRIKTPYRNLVSTASRFYDLSGLQVEGGLEGISIRAGPLQSIISAGIGFLTPPGGKAPAAGTVYPLYQSEDLARTATDLRLNVLFTEFGNLKVGSPVKYEGVPIGRIVRIHFAGDLRTIVAEITVGKKFASLFRQSTRLWLASPEFDLSGIKNLDTLASGSYVAVAPGEGPLTREFIASQGEARILPRQGLNLVLCSRHLGSLQVHSPVYYRQIKVGEVTGFDLSASFRQVLITINIAPRYQAIVREHTRFWNVSGARIEGGLLSGVSVATESLEAMVAGGIALATPGNAEMGGRVNQGHRFELDDKPEAGWLDWAPQITPVEKGNE